MFRQAALSSLILLPLLSAGCAGAEKDYPSLAIRDAERVSGAFEVEGTPPDDLTPSALPADIAARLPQLEASAQSAHERFMQALPSARNAVNAGGAATIASDNWARAQIALGDLDSLRSQTAVFLGDLDLLFVDATLANEQREEVERVRASVADMIRAEDVALEQLRARTSR